VIIKSFGNIFFFVKLYFEINSTGDIITAIDEVTQATNEGTRETTNYSN
jgi:hypothetical protein